MSKNNIFLQAFLWNDDPAYRYFLVLGLHLISIGCLFSVQAMSTSFLTRLNNYKQPTISGNLANARILIGATLSITNLIFTALEMHILVRQLFTSQKFYRVFAVQFILLLWSVDHCFYCPKWVLRFENCWPDHLHLPGSSLAPASALQMQQNPQEASREASTSEEDNCVVAAFSSRSTLSLILQDQRPNICQPRRIVSLVTLPPNLGPPPHHHNPQQHPQQQQGPGANIDQNTFETRVTRTRTSVQGLMCFRTNKSRQTWTKMKLVNKFEKPFKVVICQLEEILPVTLLLLCWSINSLYWS